MLLLLGSRYVVLGSRSWGFAAIAMLVMTMMISAYETMADTHTLQFLFLEPNASDPLNKEAAEDLRLNRDGFKRNVRTSMGGGTVKGLSFERVIMR